MDKAQAKLFAENLTGKTIGGWTVGEPLGHGKSAVVMRATKGAEVGALKAFHPELVERYGEATQLERINRERSLIGLEHSNLVKILDGGKCAGTGTLFVVMEIVAYPNLQEVLPQIPVGNVRSIIQQLAAAAYFLEQHGIVHRDIKPENVAISTDFSHVKLLDLGVLLPIGISGLTDVDHRTFIGTLQYSSPEFLERKEKQTMEGWRAVTFYQLGAVLHDLLMRYPIFAKELDPFSVLVRAVFETKPEVYGDDVKLVRICNHALIKNPSTRLQLLTWSDFLEIEKDQDLHQISNRIADRQKYFRSTTQNAESLHFEHQRLLRQSLEDLCQQMEVKLGIIFADFPFFPLRRTETAIYVPAQSGGISIFFEKNSQLGLPAHLAIALRLRLLDENNGSPIYELRGGAMLTSEVVGYEHIEIPTDIHTGGAEDIIASPAISEFLLRTLEMAYEQIDKNSAVLDAILQLKIAGDK